jgi:hypothetical protein
MMEPDIAKAGCAESGRVGRPGQVVILDLKERIGELRLPENTNVVAALRSPW